MKRQKIFLVTGIIALLILASSFYTGKDRGLNRNMVQDIPAKYRDGIYSGQSRFTYTDEPYWGNIRITIQKGSFKGVDFIIRDSSLHETFNKKYKKHFKGNLEYIQQVRNDWKGVQAYPKRLKETRDIGKVDALSGATWSYNIFKASAEDALKKAMER